MDRTQPLLSCAAMVSGSWSCRDRIHPEASNGGIRTAHSGPDRSVGLWRPLLRGSMDDRDTGVRPVYRSDSVPSFPAVFSRLFPELIRSIVAVVLRPPRRGA